MFRCVRTLRTLAPALALAALLAGPAAAQQPNRNFPVHALRGELVIGQPPEATLNGDAARLAPGLRIRGMDNLMQMSGALAGRKLLVHYTLDTEGLVHQVWILTEVEAAKKPWPTTAKQAREWQFDPLAQAWSKP